MVILITIQLKDLTINNDSVGKTFFLVNQQPYYSYIDGKKTDKVEGTAFDIAIVEQNLEKLRVKIANPNLTIDMKEKNMIQVQFDNLKVSMYQDFRNNNQIKFKATASAIKKAGEAIK